MRYILKTEDAAKLRNTILSCVKEKIDPKEKDIRSWNVITLKDSGEKVLIHTTNQWEDKGNLHLKVSKDNMDLEVYFHYWSRFPEENRSGDEAEYLFGRFTELLLVHFWDNIMKVEITKSKVNKK